MIVLSNSQTPNQVPPVIEDFIQYNNQANDPVNCEYGAVDFGVDTTPPDPLPSIPNIPGNPYEGID